MTILNKVKKITVPAILAMMLATPLAVNANTVTRAGINGDWGVGTIYGYGYTGVSDGGACWVRLTNGQTGSVLSNVNSWSGWAQTLTYTIVLTPFGGFIGYHGGDSGTVQYTSSAGLF